MERMIEETATVVAVDPGLAWVETRRRSACSHCGSADGCGAGSLAKLFRQDSSRLQIADPIGLRPGEQVAIGIPGGILLRASIAAYFLPLITLIAGSALGTALNLGEGWAALLGLAGLIAGLLVSAYVTGGTRGRERYRPRLIRRLGAVALSELGPIPRPTPDPDRRGD